MKTIPLFTIAALSLGTSGLFAMSCKSSESKAEQEPTQTALVIEEAPTPAPLRVEIPTEIEQGTAKAPPDVAITSIEVSPSQERYGDMMVVNAIAQINSAKLGKHRTLATKLSCRQGGIVVADSGWLSTQGASFLSPGRPSAQSSNAGSRANCQQALVCDGR